MIVHLHAYYFMGVGCRFGTDSCTDELSLRTVDYIVSEIPEGGLRKQQVDNILSVICKNNIVSQLKDRVSIIYGSMKQVGRKISLLNNLLSSADS